MSGPRKEMTNRTNDLCLPLEVKIIVGRKYNQKKKKTRVNKDLMVSTEYHIKRKKPRILSVQFSSVQSLSRVRFFATP